MSKFFDATQRATGVEIEPDLEVLRKSTRPNLLKEPPQTVEAENGVNPISVEVLKDDVLLSPSDTLDSSTDAEVSAVGNPTVVSSPEVFLEAGEVESDAERSPTPEPTESEVLGEPFHPAYERIVQRLLGFRGTPRQSVILVASAVAGEGVSTIARRTAIDLGRYRTERILLVDANLRAPSQHLAFHTERANGLSNVIVGSVSLTSAIRNEVSPGLSLLTAGSAVDSPPHVLTQSVLQGVVMALTSLFDWVIIDGPPVTVYPEAASLAAVAGGAVLVVRAERTRREVVEESKKVLEESGVDVIGAVLNRRKFHIPAFIYRRM